MGSEKSERCACLCSSEGTGKGKEASIQPSRWQSLRCSEGTRLRSQEPHPALFPLNMTWQWLCPLGYCTQLSSQFHPSRPENTIKIKQVPGISRSHHACPGKRPNWLGPQSLVHTSKLASPPLSLQARPPSSSLLHYARKLHHGRMERMAPSTSSCWVTRFSPSLVHLWGRIQHGNLIVSCYARQGGWKGQLRVSVLHWKVWESLF